MAIKPLKLTLFTAAAISLSAAATAQERGEYYDEAQDLMNPSEPYEATEGRRGAGLSPIDPYATGEPGAVRTAPRDMDDRMAAMGEADGLVLRPDAAMMDRRMTAGERDRDETVPAPRGKAAAQIPAGPRPHAEDDDETLADIDRMDHADEPEGDLLGGLDVLNDEAEEGFDGIDTEGTTGLSAPSRLAPGGLTQGPEGESQAWETEIVNPDRD